MNRGKGDRAECNTQGVDPRYEVGVINIENDDGDW
jgi:hypothetical protein